MSNYLNYLRLLNGFLKLNNMAKATITFTLPEEQSDFHDAVHASDYKMVLWDLDQKLRGEIKYNEKLDHKTELAYQAVRDMIHGYLNDYGVSID